MLIISMTLLKDSPLMRKSYHPQLYHCKVAKYKTKSRC